MKHLPMIILIIAIYALLSFLQLGINPMDWTWSAQLFFLLVLICLFAMKKEKFTLKRS